MRVLLLSLLVALAPGALAQGEVVDWIRAEAVSPPPVHPLQRAEVGTLTTRVSCLFVEGAVMGVPISYTVIEKPTWANVVVSPPSDVAPLDNCAEGYSQPQEASVVVMMTDAAPAFVPTPVIIEIVAGSDRPQTERVTLNVTARYFPVLDVQVPETQATVAPGGSRDFSIHVTNLGNGPTRVVAEVTEASAGVDVVLPSPVSLMSRQHGGADTSQEVLVRARAEDGGGFVTRVETFALRFVASYELDATEESDTSAVSFALHVRTGALDAGTTENGTPLPAVAAIVALVIVAALRRGRR